MILSEKVSIRITGKIVGHYKGKGYDCKVNDIVLVKPADLTKYSEIIILVKCDICGKVKSLTYASYYKSFNNGQVYCCCQKCALKKVEQAKVKRYNEKWKSEKELKEIRSFKALKNNLTPFEQSILGKVKRERKCFEKYGVKSTNQLESVKDKKEKAFLQRFGVSNPSKSKIIKNRIKKAFLEKYGFENCLSSPEVQQKRKETMIKRYGVEFSNQNKEIFEKQQKSALSIKRYKKTGIFYQGTYELDFLTNYYNKIKIEKLGHLIKYKFKGRQRYYHPDFYLPDYNLIVEVKSSYTYKTALSKNLAKRQKTLKDGYNFIFIINKKYSKFNQIINS